MDYIKSRSSQVDRLVQEFKRINDKRTKTGVVRALLAARTINGFADPEEYLADNDVEIPMEDVMNFQVEDLGSDQYQEEEH